MDPIERPERVVVGPAVIDAVTLDQAADLVIEASQSSVGPWLAVTPNLDHLVNLRESAPLRAAYATADLVVADGQPVVWLSRLAGRPLPQRVSGVDLFDAVCARAGRAGLRLYLLGSAPDVSARAQDVLRRRYTGLDLVGSFTGVVPSDPSDPRHGVLIEEIAEKAPHLVGLFMGHPKQEQWFTMMRSRLPPAAYLALGGTLDFFAGARVRSPRWLQRMGGEWLWRLSQEPGRLGRRYARDGVLAVPMAWEVFRERSAHPVPRPETGS